MKKSLSALTATAVFATVALTAGCDEAVAPPPAAKTTPPAAAPAPAVRAEVYTDMQYEITTPARCPAGYVVGQAVTVRNESGQRVNGSLCGNLTGRKLFIH